jgi:hypothetical protein
MIHSLFNKILLRLTIMFSGSNTSNISITRSLTMEKESVSETRSISKPPDADVTPRRLLLNSVAMKASRHKNRYQFCHYERNESLKPFTKLFSVILMNFVRKLHTAQHTNLGKTKCHKKGQQRRRRKKPYQSFTYVGCEI